jgi:hypothetical protein
MFTIFYLITKAHNMVAIMLDPWLKNIKVVHEFVENNVVAFSIMRKYNQKIVLPMFLHMYFYLNHKSASIGYENHQYEYDFFGQHVYDKHVISYTLKNELQLFCCLCELWKMWNILSNDEHDMKPNF